ncbi:MAG: hypothetical protein RDV41_08710, partial [Planctomycetota bacterium]|nr:hypothetical protein [Planctomycetota bacterium]
MELKDYLGILKRRFGWFLLTFVVGCGLYGTAFVSEPLSYEAKASLLIQFEVFDPLTTNTAIPMRVPGITSATREQLLNSEEVFEIAVKICTAERLSGSRVTTEEEAERILSERNSPLLTDRAYLSEAVHDMMKAMSVSRRNQGQIVEVVARSANAQEAISWANAHALASEDMSRREVLSSYQTALADIHQNLERNAGKQKDLQTRIDQMFESELEPTRQLSGTEEEVRRIRDEARKLKSEITGIDYEVQRAEFEVF